jgi:arylsulfatase A-like enzyme
MIRKWKFIVLLVLFLALTVYVFLPVLAPGGPEFDRTTLEEQERDTTHFRVDNALRRIYFKKNGEEKRLKDIPTINGSYFYLRGKKLVRFYPPLNGNIRVYSYLYLEPMGKTGAIDLEITMLREGEKEETVLEHIRCGQKAVSRPLYKDLDLRHGGALLFKFRGRGIVYFSRPIFYEPLDPSAPEKSKHIFFIGVDTFRGDLVGQKVNGQSLTPHMDAFIEDSVYLENTYAQTSWTLPSFTSLFTALNEYNHEVGVNQSLPPDKPVLTEPLSAEFLTFGFHGGKVMDGRWGFSRGFDYYKKFQQAAALYPRGGESLFNKAAEVLEQGRFPHLFMFLHTYQVHAPYTPPIEYLTRLNPNPAYKKIDLVNFSEPQKTFQPLPEPERLATEELYRAEVLAFDDFFGAFIKKLKAMNLYEHAMIVLMSDHGEEFFEHRGWGHSHSLYNELTRVPAIIKFPGNRFGGTRLTGPAAVVDLMPTVLSYYGIEYGSEGLDGKNLMPLIEGKDEGSKERGYVVSTISTGRYFEALPPRIALMFGRYKLIYNEPFTKKDLEFFKGFTAPPMPPKYELYDLHADPGETRNIMGSHPGIKEKMMREVLKIRKIIAQREAKRGKKKRPLDKEVREQLESLGYL